MRLRLDSKHGLLRLHENRFDYILIYYAQKIHTFFIDLIRITNFLVEYNIRFLRGKIFLTVKRGGAETKSE